MSNGNLGNIDKLYKKRVKPIRGEKDSLYFIGEPSSEFIDFYVTDKNGYLKPIINNTRTQSNRKIIHYNSEIDLPTYYYYGYKYNNGTFKIVRVQKGNVIVQDRAIITSGGYTSNWNNKLALTYN